MVHFVKNFRKIDGTDVNSATIVYVVLDSLR